MKVEPTGKMFRNLGLEISDARENELIREEKGTNRIRGKWKWIVTP